MAPGTARPDRADRLNSREQCSDIERVETSAGDATGAKAQLPRVVPPKAKRAAATAAPVLAPKHDRVQSRQRDQEQLQKKMRDAVSATAASRGAQPWGNACNGHGQSLR
jgi:hypothetical protein